jgi:hypothetical protein
MFVLPGTKPHLGRGHKNLFLSAKCALVRALLGTVITTQASSLTPAHADYTSYLPRSTRASVMYSPAATISQGRIYLALQTPFGRERFKFELSPSAFEDPEGVHFVGASGVRANTDQQHKATLSQFSSEVRVFFVSRRSGEPMAAKFSLSSANGTIIPSSVRLSRVRRYASIPCGDEAPNSAAVKAPGGSGLGRYQSDSVSKLAAATLDSTGSVLSPTREIELAAYYDAGLAREQGANSRNYIEATVHAANNLHLSQLGLVIKLKSVLEFQIALRPDEQIEADILLRIFRARVALSGPRPDLHHLFTGALLTGKTIGLAYVGAACIERGIFAAGLSRSVPPALQPIVLSHELGHGLGAYHEETPGSVMSPTLSAENNIFTPITKEQIYDFIGERAACITPPREEPVSLAVTIEPGAFVATATLSSSTSRRCSVALQTPLRSPKSSRSSRKKRARWRTIARAGVVDAQGVSRPSVQFSTELPALYRTKSKGYHFRAVSRCPGSRAVSRIQTVVPPKTDAITIGSISLRDWLTNLIRSFRNQS